MTNKEFQQMLAQWPDDTPIRLRYDGCPWVHDDKIVDFRTEQILLTSETAYVDGDAPDEEWDTEDGKVCLGNGQQFLLINPIIL